MRYSADCRSDPQPSTGEKTGSSSSLRSPTDTWSSHRRSERDWYRRRHRLEVGVHRTESSSRVFRDDSMLCPLGPSREKRNEEDEKKREKSKF